VQNQGGWHREYQKWHETAFRRINFDAHEITCDAGDKGIPEQLWVVMVQASQTITA
jgi:hypothetical protein